MLIDSALKMVLGRLAPAGPNARLTVLIFHRVLAARDPLRPHEPTVTEFADMLDWVQRWFTVLPLSEAITRLRSASLPERALAITFDDGYADNRDLAVPELQRRGLSATFFIATGYLDGGRMFNDTVIEAIRGCRSEVLDVSDLGLGVHRVGNDDERRAAIGALLPKLKQLGMEARLEASAKVAERARVRLPNDLMMTSDDLAYVAKVGMELGGHTDSHPILARLPEAAARSEIEHRSQASSEHCRPPDWSVRLSPWPSRCGLHGCNTRSGARSRLRCRVLDNARGRVAPVIDVRFAPVHALGSQSHTFRFAVGT